jgi:hypothetical protein
MALNHGIGSLPNKRESGLPRFNPPPINKPRPGTLIIRDTFHSRDGAVPHGAYVTKAALHEGHKGPIQLSPELPSNWQGRKAVADLTDGKLEPKAAGKALDNLVEGEVTSLLDSQARNLNSLVRQGHKNSALNLSLGLSKASVVESCLSPLGSIDSKNPKTAEFARTMTENLARALDVDPEKVLSGDPEIHGPERQKLQQRLIDRTGKTLDNSTAIADSRGRYNSAVSEFEQNNNSVVISAGNWAGSAERLERQNHGHPLAVPPDFTTNVLENDAVTSVGATAWKRNGSNFDEHRADYSVSGPGVDVYANGSVGLTPRSMSDSRGTSYAAPKVAATMANLHRLHPKMSSSQVESLMKQSLTHGLSQPDDEMRVLDFQKNFQFLQSNTY